MLLSVLLTHLIWIDCGMTYIGPVHKGANHVPKAVSDHDPLPDWVHELNYVRSQALQPPSRSRTGSAYCEVIFCSYCADWPFDPCTASARISKMHTHESRSEELCIQKSSKSGFLGGSWSKTPFSLRLKAWFERVLRSQMVKSGYQIRKGSESRFEMAFRTWFTPLWKSPF